MTATPSTLPTMAALLELAADPIGALRMQIALNQDLPASVTSRARYIAEVAHRGQPDKVGADYIGHPHRIAVSLIAQKASHVAVALGWLHDVVEDTALTLDDIAAAFPLMDDLIAALDAITARPNEPRTDYYDRVKANAIALEVKLVDIADNTDPARTAQLDEATRDRLADKYAKALAHLTGGEG